MHWTKKWKFLSHATHLYHHPLLKRKFVVIHAPSVGNAEPWKPSTVNTTLNASTLLVPACDPFERFTEATYPNIIPTCTFSCLHARVHLGDENIWVFPSHFHFSVQTCQSKYWRQFRARGKETEERGPPLAEGGMFHWYGRREEGKDSCKNECRIKNQYVPLMIWPLPTAVDKLLRTQGTRRMKRRDTGGCTTPSIVPREGYDMQHSPCLWFTDTHWFPIPVISSGQEKHTYTHTHIHTRPQLDIDDMMRC